MTIDEAIEILDEIIHWDFKHDRQDCDDAIKLGSAALKAWDAQRKDTKYHHIYLLPGETKAEHPGKESRGQTVEG
ncbi:hypothetical protein ES704_02772 [subsurface metagenome]|jgi:hypothetical protein